MLRRDFLYGMCEYYTIVHFQRTFRYLIHNMHFTFRYFIYLLQSHHSIISVSFCVTSYCRWGGSGLDHPVLPWN